MQTGAAVGGGDAVCTGGKTNLGGAVRDITGGKINIGGVVDITGGLVIAVNCARQFPLRINAVHKKLILM